MNGLSRKMLEKSYQKKGITVKAKKIKSSLTEVEKILDKVEKKKEKN